MTRAAGDSTHYTIQVVDKDGHPRGMKHGFVSVTSVINATLNKGSGMLGWAQKITVEGMKDLLDQGYDLGSYDKDQLLGLLKEYGFTPYATRDRAAGRGTDVHEVLEVGLKEGLQAALDAVSALPEEMQGYGTGVVAWLESREPEPLLIEEPVVSFKHHVAGTLDILWQATKDIAQDSLIIPRGTKVLSDLKTSKGVYESHGIQLGMYGHILEELDIPWDVKTVVRVTPEGSFEEVFIDTSHEVFLALLSLYRITKEGGK